MAVFMLLMIAYANLNNMLGILSGRLSENELVVLKYLIPTLVWCSGALVIRQIINYILWKKYSNEQISTSAPRLMKNILNIILFLATITAVLAFVFDVPLTGFWATSSVTALVVGFALRNIILDLFSGLAVNLEKPYQMGDWIKIHQKFSNEVIIGEVKDINWRATHILTEENTNVVIPNSIMTTLVFTTNYWHKSKPVRFEILFTFDFSISPGRVKRILKAATMEAISNYDLVKENPAQVLIHETNELGVVYKLRFWIIPWKNISPSSAKDAVYQSVLNHLAAAGLTLAYPKEDVYTSSMPVRQLDGDHVSDRAKLLSRITVFSILQEDELMKLSSLLVRRDFAAGHELVTAGDHGTSMFILLEGLLEVYILSEKAEEVKVAGISPPGYFGEMSLFTGEPRSATVKCLTDVVIYEITKKAFTDILINRKEIIDTISEEIIKRKAMNEKGLKEFADLQSNAGHHENQHSLINKIKHFFGISAALKNENVSSMSPISQMTD